jgi:hypothetical protein
MSLDLDRIEQRRKKMANETLHSEQRQMTEIRAREEQRQAEMVAPPVYRELEQWDLREGESLEEKRQAVMTEVVNTHEEFTRRIQERLGEQTESVVVRRSANVSTPPVQQKVARESLKQRREREKKLRRARGICPVADQTTVELNESIIGMLALRQSSAERTLASVPEAKQLSKTDLDIFRAFSRTYRTNRFGRPLSVVDREAMLENRDDLIDFMSDNYFSRAKYFDRCAKEILFMQFLPEMYETSYILKNAAKLRDMLDKIKAFDALMKKYPDLYENSDELEKDMFMATVEMGRRFGEHFGKVLASKGINAADGRVYGRKDMSVIEDSRAELPESEKKTKEAVSDYWSRVHEAFDREIDRNMEEYERETRRRMIDEEYGGDESAQDPRGELGFTTGLVSCYLRDSMFYVRELIERNPESYARHKDLVDALYREFFQLHDSMADQYYKQRVFQSACDLINEKQPEFNKDSMKGYYKREFLFYLGNKPEVYNQRYQRLRSRANMMLDAFEHLLNRKERTAVASVFLEDFLKRHPELGVQQTGTAENQAGQAQN